MNSFLIVVALVSAARAASLDWRTIGGRIAEIGQFPYQVSLRQNNNHFCSGSIINENWVLTAAHCVYDLLTTDLIVVAGTNELTTGGDEYQVQQIVTHSSFVLTQLHNDIAMLKVAWPIQFYSKVEPIPLSTEDIGAGAMLTLIGWDLTSYPDNIPDDLQFITEPCISVADCSESYRFTGLTVDGTQIYTSTQNNEGTCLGDTGGPVVFQGQLVGIISWGRPCATGAPDVHTRVSKYIDWIAMNMQ